MHSEQIDVIIIRGAPGAGKSSTAKSLTRYFPGGVRMEIDNIRSMIISVNWTNQEEHVNILNASTKLVYDFFKLGFKPIIVVDTFSGNKVEKFNDLLLQLDNNLSIKIFGLYVTEKELERRINARTQEDFKDYNICKKLNVDVLKFKYENEFQIDTTGQMPDSIARIIYELM